MTNDEVSRRLFLARSGQYLLLTMASAHWAPGQVPSSENPFTLGVASGDPEYDGFVLWTRLATDPLHGGGMRPERIEVEWQVAEDEGMSRMVDRGVALATPDLAHSVHVEVSGLQPNTWYWYRFKTGSHESPIGRTRTAPDPRIPLSKFNFAFVSCQNYEIGFYTAYRHLAEENLDLVVHLGDYIYEGAARDDRPRKHDGPEPTTLLAYRNRHALYRSDPDLQRAHARFPWLVTWDDHEVENNYANDISEDNAPRGEFLKRRAAAYQAYYEHMPLRRRSLPKGPSLQLYRQINFGDLAQFFVLDTRQYRSDQPCGDGNRIGCEAAASPNQTMLGKAQEAWLMNAMGDSRARWNVVANQVMMASFDSRPGPEIQLSMDKWNGYQVSRDRLLRFLHDRRISNPVVITGDIHENWVADLKLDWRDPKSATVAAEFVGTSITSKGDGADTNPAVEACLPENPHIHFFNDQRGYVRCTVTPDLWRSDYRIVPYVSRPGAPIIDRISFFVENGRPGIQRT